MRSDLGTVLFTSNEERDSGELQGKRGACGYTARIPLADLQPGTYVLAVEARSRLGTRAAVGREIPFTVEPSRIVR